MPRERAPYDTAEVERVKRNLTGILSLTPELISSVIRANPYDVRPIADVTQRFAEQMKDYKWQNAILAQLPLSAWEVGPGHALRINPSTSASMRYLARDQPNEEALELVRARRTLFDSLLARMSPPVALAYRPMLTWVDAEECRSAGVSNYPLSSDTEYGYSLLIIEELLSNQIYIYDQRWRENERLPPSESTPAVVTHASTIMAVEHWTPVIETWLNAEKTLSDSVPESLLARMSANLSANRALLELTAMDARGMEAANMCVPFLDELNRQGITGVPVSMVACSPPEAAVHLRELLTDWFAHNGRLVQPGTFFRRHMTNSDIDMVVDWSQQLQHLYVTGRGQNGAVVDKAAKTKAEESHCNPGNLFIFAMAMAGAFYMKTPTARELTGHSNAKYAVFPDRGEVAKGNRATPPTHAGQLLQQAYGQMFFANSGWELKANRVREYAETTSIKRAYAQQLLFFAAKGRSSRQLLALFKNLQELLPPERSSSDITVQP